MRSLDPTRSKLALTRVRFDAEGPEVLPLSNQTEERRGDSQHFSEIPHYFLCARGRSTVSRERAGPDCCVWLIWLIPSLCQVSQSENTTSRLSKPQQLDTDSAVVTWDLGENVHIYLSDLNSKLEHFISVLWSLLKTKSWWLSHRWKLIITQQ